MEELKLQHQTAQDAEITTVLELDYKDRTVYRMGGLLITSVCLKDRGLVG